MSFSSDLGRRIRIRRKELGIIQKDLCEDARISVGFLSDIENGKRNISVIKLDRIAQVLFISIDELIRGESD